MEDEFCFFLHRSMSCSQWMLFGTAESTRKVPEARTWIFGPKDQEEVLVVDNTHHRRVWDCLQHS